MKMKILTKYLKIIAAILMTGLLAGCDREGSIAVYDDETGEQELYDDDRSKNESEIAVTVENETDFEDAYVYVQVCGAVNAPGVYRISGRGRVFEAVEAAGDFTAEACTEAVNLARTVTDEMVIYIPTCAEVENGTYEYPHREESYTEDGNEGLRAQENGGKININTAGKEELMALPGVGDSRASAIISYREEHGGFHDITDIMNVSGIKQAAFDRIKDRITV